MLSCIIKGCTKCFVIISVVSMISVLITMSCPIETHLQHWKGGDFNKVSITVQAMLKTIRLLCITVSVGRSRSAKNAADTKLFAAPGLAKSKYRRFSRPTSTAMHKRYSKNQTGLNCDHYPLPAAGKRPDAVYAGKKLRYHILINVIMSKVTDLYD